MQKPYAVSPRSFRGPEGQEDMPYLLTPGPLTTSRGVKLAMLADWGSWDQELREVTADIRRRLLKIAGADHHECVLLQGAGSYGIEASLGSFTPAARHHIQRMVKRCDSRNGPHRLALGVNFT